jgi:GNAT superfamily N-acetyltransferase
VKSTLNQLRKMQDMASRLWGPGRRWTPGEIAWAFLTGPDEKHIRLFAGGWAWRQPDYLVVLAAHRETALQAIAWAGDGPVQVADGDLVVRDAVRRAGLAELTDAPFDVDLRLSTAGVAGPAVPDGYVVRSARECDDLLEVHRAAWRPADLPFAPGHEPSLSPEAMSSLTAQVLADVQATWLYRRDLHFVVEAPDHTLAASCIAWLDPTTGTAAIEPLGVRPAYRRRGLAGALCLRVAQCVQAAGGHEVVIHPRGDAAYPAPLGAYLRCGFRRVGQTRLYARP